ncbi:MULTISPECIES: alpha/beta fold hydrolase [Alteromonadaceae]|uniref:alpha/beta hydrolase family protein n=1 Tax=Alteromonadaceae TaxID=72275 RepID=UPI00310C35F3
MNIIKYLVCLQVFLATEVLSGETSLFLDNGEYQIPAIYSAPSGMDKYPAIILLHGTASNKNEVGDLYAILAKRLRDNNIASIRIDFAGTGDSEVDYSQYTLASAVRDADMARGFLIEQPQILADSLAVLGFSQGGLIAQLLVIEHPELAALVTWSSVAGDGGEPFSSQFGQYYAEAKNNGVAELTFEWRAPLNLSVQWFEQVKKQKSLTELANYPGAVLAIAGGADTIVDPISSLRLIQAAGSEDAQAVVLKGADHVFNVLDPTATEDEVLLKITLQWLLEKLH